MPKTKISEFSATANSNTDINSINIAEGCAPSNINDAIRELMAELKDFQAGTKGDSFNGPVGTSTAAAGAFTTLSSTGNTTLGDASGDTVTINGAATFANVNPTLSAGTANGVLYLNGSKVATSGSALVFDGTNLGLGVTPSAWGGIFNAVQGAYGGCIAFQNNGPGTKVGNNWYYNGSNYIYTTTNAAARYDLSDSHKWYTAPSGTAGNAITFTQAMTLDSSGNLLVGMTSYGVTNAGASLSPTASSSFYVAGGTALTIGRGVSDGTAVQFNRSGTNCGNIDVTTTSLAINASSTLLLNTGGTERARIDSSGNLLVGTTTAVEKLTVAGNISINTSGNPYLQIKTSGAGNNPYILLQADTASWNIQGTFSNAGDELYLIYSGSNRGYFNSATGAYVPVSDRNLKKDIIDISYGLPAIMALRPVEYLMKDEADDAQKHLGFIAQEAQTAVPSAVSEMTDGMLGMDKTELIAVLVKAIQEQQAIIEQLKARLDAANL